jgi:hypothetical protein
MVNRSPNPWRVGRCRLKRQSGQRYILRKRSRAISEINP